MYKYFNLLLRIEGDSGGRDIILANPDDILKIDTDSPACVYNINTMDDLMASSKGSSTAL